MNYLFKLLSKIKSRSMLISRKWLFILFEQLFSANDEYWLFCTWENHSHTLDNPRAVFESIKNDAYIKKIVFLKKNSTPFNLDEGENIKFVMAESICGAYFLARSKVIITGYGLLGISSYSRHLSTKHLIVQLWHGVPLKRIGKLFPKEDWWAKETPKYSLLVSSADQDRKYMAMAFSPIPIEKVLQSGLPRNDLILAEDSHLPLDLFGPIDELRRKLKGRKLVLYAPTWRESEKNLYQFTSVERDRLESLLVENNAVLGIRGHSNVRHSLVYSNDQDSSSIISLNHVPDVNVLFRDVNVLITDYSSIYIDFLITGKPIIHFVYDLDAYLNERGFLYEINDAFAGPAVRTFEDLVLHLDRLLRGETKDLGKYTNAFSLFHQHGARPSDSVVIAVKNDLLAFK